MATEQEIVDALKNDAASGIRRASGDSGSTELMPADDRIRLANYAQNVEKKRGCGGLATCTFVSGGPVV